MHDKVNDEETKNQVNNDINEYFNLDSLDLENFNTSISQVKTDSDEEND